MKMEYANLDASEQKAYVSSNAVRFVQNQAPCSNMSKKAKQFYWSSKNFMENFHFFDLFLNK